MLAEPGLPHQLVQIQIQKGSSHLQSTCLMCSFYRIFYIKVCDPVLKWLLATKHSSCYVFRLVSKQTPYDIYAPIRFKFENLVLFVSLIKEPLSKFVKVKCQMPYGGCIFIYKEIQKKKYKFPKWLFIIYLLKSDSFNWKNQDKWLILPVMKPFILNKRIGYFLGCWLWNVRRNKFEMADQHCWIQMTVTITIYEVFSSYSWNGWIRNHVKKCISKLEPKNIWLLITKIDLTRSEISKFWTAEQSGGPTIATIYKSIHLGQF